MPVELLLGVLLVSVVVNAALLFWLSRADHVRIHWSRHLLTLFDSLRSPAPTPANDIPTVRRRSLFVAENASARGAEPAASLPFSSAAALPTTRARLSQTLPSDLADFLSRSASVGSNADVFGFTASGDGAASSSGPGFSGDDDGQTILARQPSAPRGVSAGMALDPLTGLEGPASWSRIVEIENARLLRYRRPVTVVMAEVEGLKRLAERLGDEPVDRLLPVIAGAFRREARSSDWVARVGHGRFAAFLPETDEIQAINYVERIRLVCEPWLTSSAVPLRLAIGWSSPTASSDIESALQRAEERMHLDRRMPGKSVQAPRVVPARVVSVPRMAPTASPSKGNLVDSVPPAETGRAGEWIGPEIPSEGAVSGQSGEVSTGKGRRRPSRTKSGPASSAPS